MPAQWIKSNNPKWDLISLDSRNTPCQQGRMIQLLSPLLSQMRTHTRTNLWRMMSQTKSSLNPETLMTSWGMLVPLFSLGPQWRHPCLGKASVSAAIPPRDAILSFSLLSLCTGSGCQPLFCVLVSVSWRWNCSHWILHSVKGACCFLVSSYCTLHCMTNAMILWLLAALAEAMKHATDKTNLSWEHGMSSDNNVLNKREESLTPCELL